MAGERYEEGGCEGGECEEGGREVSPRLVLKMSNHSASSCLEEGGRRGGRRWGEERGGERL